MLTVPRRRGGSRIARPADRVEVIELLRRLRMTAAEIAECLGMALSTVSAVLKRIGRASSAASTRLSRPTATSVERRASCCTSTSRSWDASTAPAGAVTGDRSSQNANRRQRRRGGPAGWEFVHVCIDDATRLAYAEVLSDEKATTAVAFLRRALAFYRRHGIQVQRAMTDNGAAYRSITHALTCRALGTRHLRT